MSTWNYRLVARKDCTFAVHEIYYNSAGEAWSMTANPVDLGPFDDASEIEEMISSVLCDLKEGIFIEPDTWAKPDFDAEGLSK